MKIFVFSAYLSLWESAPALRKMLSTERFETVFGNQRGSASSDG